MREFDLLRHIYEANPSLAKRVTLSPGDDMGAVSLSDEQVLVTVDQLADGVHVDVANTSLARVARKAMTRNLSDVAAMAAMPLGAVCAATLPRDWSQSKASELFDHMQRIAGSFDCPLFGGDISLWDGPMMLTVTVLAEARGITPVLRHTALPGHWLYVTGALGGSLQDIAGYQHHLDFTPRLTLARTLAGSTDTRPSAMIDLSDGLANDLPHLLERDHTLGAVLDIDHLPLSPGARLAAKRTGKPAWHHAMADGEDYELLFTASDPQLPDQIEGVAITRIGKIVTCDASDAPKARIALCEKSKTFSTLETLDLQGWEHHT